MDRYRQDCVRSASSLRRASVQVSEARATSCLSVPLYSAGLLVCRRCPLLPGVSIRLIRLLPPFAAEFLEWLGSALIASFIVTRTMHHRAPYAAWLGTSKKNRAACSW
jgi:hypothetical protein